MDYEETTRHLARSEQSLLSRGQYGSGYGAVQAGDQALPLSLQGCPEEHQQGQTDSARIRLEHRAKRDELARVDLQPEPVLPSVGQGEGGVKDHHSCHEELKEPQPSLPYPRRGS